LEGAAAPNHRYTLSLCVTPPGSGHSPSWCVLKRSTHPLPPASCPSSAIRVIYDQLSKDPNSLANLDQDLPNYAQLQIPIFSLPQVGGGVTDRAMF
jgi:hypothetical protein